MRFRLRMASIFGRKHRVLQSGIISVLGTLGNAPWRANADTDVFVPTEPVHIAPGAHRHNPTPTPIPQPPPGCCPPPPCVGCMPGLPKDIWHTPHGNAGSRINLPAGYFGRDSDTVDFPIEYVGVPLANHPLGNLGVTDTILERSGDPFDVCDPTSPFVEKSVTLEVIALQLAGTSLLPVTYLGVNQEEWYVDVDLSSVPAPLGLLTAKKTHCNGGTYQSVFHLRPRFTFTRVSDGAIRVLDTGLEGLPPLPFTSDGGTWVHAIPAGAVDYHLSPVATSFHPGFDQKPVPVFCPPDCNGNGRRDGCDLAAGTSFDWDGDAAPDECAGGGTTVVTVAGGPGTSGCVLRLTPTTSPGTACGSGTCAATFGPNCFAQISNTLGLSANLVATFVAVDLQNRISASQCGSLLSVQSVGPRIILRTTGGARAQACITGNGVPLGTLGGAQRCEVDACNFHLQVGLGTDEVLPPITAGTDKFATLQDGNIIPQQGSWIGLDLPAGFFEVAGQPPSLPVSGLALPLDGVAVSLPADNSDTWIMRTEDTVFGRCTGDFSSPGGPNGVYSPDGIVDAIDLSQFNFCQGTGIQTGDCRRFDFDGDDQLSGSLSSPASSITGDAAVLRCLQQSGDNPECCPARPSFPQEGSAETSAGFSRMHLRNVFVNVPVRRSGLEDVPSESWSLNGYLSSQPAPAETDDVGPCDASQDSEPNDVLITADNLGVLARNAPRLIAGTICDTACDLIPVFPGDFDADVYRFTLAFRDMVSIRIHALTDTIGCAAGTSCGTGLQQAITSLWLYDDNGILLTPFAPGGEEDPRILTTLDTGVYYILVGAGGQFAPPNPRNVMCSVTSEPEVGGGTIDPTGEYELSLGVVPRSTVRITKTHPNGGTFDANLHLSPLYTYEQVCDPSHAMLVDTGELGLDALVLNVDDADWVGQATEPDLRPGDDDFVPGVRENNLVQSASPVQLHSTLAPTEHNLRLLPSRIPECAAGPVSPTLNSAAAVGSWQSTTSIPEASQPFVPRSDGVIGLMSDLDTPPVGREAADSFIVPANASVVRWRGGYSGGSDLLGGAAAEDFTIQFFQDYNEGRPGGLWASLHVGNTATRSPGPLTDEPGRQIYEYSYDLGTLLHPLAGFRVWISVLADTTGDPSNWFFATAAGGDCDGAAATREFDDGTGVWHPVTVPPTDLSFDIDVAGSTHVICVSEQPFGLGYRFDPERFEVNGIDPPSGLRWRGVSAAWSDYTEIGDGLPAATDSAAVRLAMHRAGFSGSDIDTLWADASAGATVAFVFLGTANFACPGAQVSGVIERLCHGAVLDEYPAATVLTTKAGVQGVAYTNGTASVLVYSAAVCESDRDCGAGESCDGCSCHGVPCFGEPPCDDMELCTLDRCNGPVCTFDPILYGDVNRTGFANLDDILCLLDTFGGGPNSAACWEGGVGAPVPFESKDFYPCPTAGDPNNMGDGFINVGDVLSLLNLASGIPPDPACDACNGMARAVSGGSKSTECLATEPGLSLGPVEEPRRSGESAVAATLILEADRRVLGVGEVVKVRAFARGVPELRAYQVGLSAVPLGAGRGGLVLESIVLDSKQEQPAIGVQESYSAVSVARGAALRVLASGSADASEQSYLATFVFRASAVGPVRIRWDAAETMLFDSSSRPVQVSGAEALVLVNGTSRTPSEGR